MVIKKVSLFILFVSFFFITGCNSKPKPANSSGNFDALIEIAEETDWIQTYYYNCCIHNYTTHINIYYEFLNSNGDFTAIINIGWWGDSSYANIQKYEYNDSGSRTQTDNKNTKGDGPIQQYINYGTVKTFNKDEDKDSAYAKIITSVLNVADNRFIEKYGIGIA